MLFYPMQVYSYAFIDQISVSDVGECSLQLMQDAW